SIYEKYLLNVRWKLRQTVVAAVNLVWSVGDRPFSFYRVQSTCKPAKCPPIGPTTGCTDNFKYTVVANIYARNLTEVCQKLRDRNLTFPIASIQKFSIPPNVSDITSDTNLTCNSLQDVTPPITFLPCQDLLIDITVVVPMAMAMTAFVSVLSYQGSGRLLATGGIKPISNRTIMATGGFGLNGVGTGENHDYASSPSGNITLSGSADLALSFWEWD